MLSAAREQIRLQFRENRSLDDTAATPALKHAEDVAKFLRQNIVQGTQTMDDTYSMISFFIHDIAHQRDGPSADKLMSM